MKDWEPYCLEWQGWDVEGVGVALGHLLLQLLVREAEQLEHWVWGGGGGGGGEVGHPKGGQDCCWVLERAAAVRC